MLRDVIQHAVDPFFIVIFIHPLPRIQISVGQKRIARYKPGNSDFFM
jgi:hypothetical protein